MDIICIDITNICSRSCSNCSRSCGHYTKDRIKHLSLEYFEKAVDTLTKFPDVIVAVIGGEPTAHPQFPEICRIMREKISDKARRFILTNPSNPHYMKHLPDIYKTFGKFNLNSHLGPIQHTPILVASEDFKDIPKKDMDKIINNCWAQNNWSACINHKGAYFCEIAGALAMLFDGPDGWDIEKHPDWWKKEIPEYKEQIEWACSKCGCAIPLTPRSSSDVIDDVSISNLKRLEAINSPKVKQGKYELMECSKNCVDETQIRCEDWYWGNKNEQV